jgi:23S rRNA (guanosine2251-2'-O)-methyltransferase
MKRIVIENLRSAYNVGNIIRTADALWRGVIFVWYTARPDHKEVKKTALWSEISVPNLEFNELSDALYYMNTHGLTIAAELTESSIPLKDIQTNIKNLNKSWGDTFVIVGNEVTWVEQDTLNKSDIITHIPMLGIKESLNVGQAAAIIMWELS